METLLTIMAGIFGGTSIFQFITIRSQRKMIAGQAGQEEAKADGLNLANIRELLHLQGEQLLVAENRNKTLSENYEGALKKMREYDYKMQEFERKINGMEKVINQEMSRRTYAEAFVCLNKDCDNRRPTLGNFKGENK